MALARLTNINPTPTRSVCAASLVVCGNQDEETTGAKWKIGGSDAMTLIDGVDGNIIFTSGELPDLGADDKMYIWNLGTQAYYQIELKAESSAPTTSPLFSSPSAGPTAAATAAPTAAPAFTVRVPSSISLSGIEIPEEEAPLAALIETIAATLEEFVGETVDVTAINGETVRRRRLGADVVVVDFDIVVTTTCMPTCDSSSVTLAVTSSVTSTNDAMKAAVTDGR